MQKPRKKSQFGLSLPTATWPEVALFECGQVQMGEILGITQTEVSQLTICSEPVLHKNRRGKYVLKEAVSDFIRYLKHKAKHSKKQTAEELDELKTKAQVENIQLRNEKKILALKREAVHEVKLSLLAAVGALQEFLKEKKFDGREVQSLVDAVKAIDPKTFALSDEDREGITDDDEVHF